MASGLSELITLINTKILTGGNKTKAVNHRAVEQEIASSSLNIVDCGNVLEELVGYTTDLAPSDDKHLVPKKWIVDLLAGFIKADGSVPMLDDLQFPDTRGLEWPSSGNYIKDNSGDLYINSVGVLTLYGSQIRVAEDIQFDNTFGTTWASGSFLKDTSGDAILNAADTLSINASTGLAIYTSTGNISFIGDTFTFQGSVDGDLTFSDTKGITWSSSYIKDAAGIMTINVADYLQIETVNETFIDSTYFEVTASVAITLTATSHLIMDTPTVWLNDTSAAIYFGTPVTDGTWRVVRSGNDLIYQRRESGSYITKQTISA